MLSANDVLSSNDQLLTSAETAKMLGLGLDWIQKNRRRKDGKRINFLRIGNRVRYRRSDVLAFIQANMSE